MCSGGVLLAWCWNGVVAVLACVWCIMPWWCSERKSAGVIRWAPRSPASPRSLIKERKAPFRRMEVDSHSHRRKLEHARRWRWSARTLIDINCGSGTWEPAANRARVVAATGAAPQNRRSRRAEVRSYPRLEGPPRSTPRTPAGPAAYVAQKHEVGCGTGWPPR